MEEVEDRLNEAHTIIAALVRRAGGEVTLTRSEVLAANPTALVAVDSLAFADGSLRIRIQDASLVTAEGRVAELRRVEREATPRPWKTRENKWAEAEVVSADAVIADGGALSDNDATLVASVRNALPALLDVAEAAERVRKDRREPCVHDLRAGADPAVCIAHGRECPWVALDLALARLEAGHG